MSLLYMDSCDFYATADLPLRWQSVSGATISVGTGRRGTNSLRLADSGVADLAPGGDPTAIICGFAYRTALAAAGPVWYLWDPVNVRNQVLIAQGTDGTLSALRGGAAAVRGDATGAVTLGTSAVALTANTYAYVEIQVRLHPTAGSVVVHVDRVEVLNLPNVNTVNVGGGYFTVMGFRGAGDGNDVDDVYVCDPAGPGPWNGLLGDCQVDACRPIGAGASTGWSPTGGANWQNVADTAPDADATYNTAFLIGAVDTYAMQPAAAGVTTILGVQHNLTLRKTDTASCIVAPVVSRAGVMYESVRHFPLDPTFAVARVIQPVNPATGLLWLVGDFNASQFGAKRLA
jgi:hypothetical protein